MNFYSIFAGKMLGDGYLNYNRSRARFAFIHTLKDKEYAEYCYNIFSKYIEFSSGVKVEHIYDKRVKKIYSRVLCQSRVSSFLDEMYKIWYKDKRKVIPMDWVEKHLTPEGVAIWYQDDGCLKNGGRRIILSVESFSDTEKDFLLNLLDKKFNIKAKIDSQGRIDISSMYEIRKFQALIEPYIHFSMRRKSMIHYWEKWIAEWENIDKSETKISRTSIYFPAALYNNLKGKGYSTYLNNALDIWLDDIWHKYLLNDKIRYLWLINKKHITEERHLLTPRFYSYVKKRLDIISKVTGLERSELVTIMLRETT